MEQFSPFDWLSNRSRKATCLTAVSKKPSLESAVKEVAANLAGIPLADLALVFASESYATDLPRLLPILRNHLSSKHWLGCLGGGVIATTASGEAKEFEGETALTVTLFSLPGASLKPFSLELHSLPDLDGSSKNWQEWVGIEPEKNRSMLLLVDPTASAINDLVSGLDYAYPGASTIGGIAGSHSASHGSLLFGDQVVAGAVGCAIGGDWVLEPVVAQGCKPIGPVFAVEQAKKNVLLQLSHEDKKDSPVAFLQRVLADLSQEERELVKHSLFLGIERRDLAWGLITGAPEAHTAFLVRNLIGVDPINGAVAVAERLRVGQNVQFQLREADASRQEAKQLLSSAVAGFSTPPLFGLLMACLGRGKNLYGVANGDVDIARQLVGELPISGVFCNGEIGPLGGATYVHGYTACWGLLRYSPISQSSQ